VKCRGCGRELTLTPADSVRLVKEGEPDVLLRADDVHHAEPPCALWSGPERAACLPTEPEETTPELLPAKRRKYSPGLGFASADLRACMLCGEHEASHEWICDACGGACAVVEEQPALHAGKCFPAGATLYCKPLVLN